MSLGPVEATLDPGRLLADSRRRRALVLGLLSLGLGLTILMAAALGSVPVPLGETLRIILARILGQEYLPPESAWTSIILLLRLPRVLGAALVGAALASAGAAMQGVFRNPMADPGILGVSGGSSLGAVIGIALGLGRDGNLWLMPLTAFGGAVLAALAVVMLSIHRGRFHLGSLILAGLATGTLTGAATSLVLNFTSRDNVSQFVFWSMGNPGNIRWETLGAFGLPLLGLLAAVPLAAPALNVMALGEEQAAALGLRPGRTRILILLLASAMTALAVCLCGPVGFVGLMVPHIIRLAGGGDHRSLLPGAMVGGGIFLCLCDLLARLLIPGQELPVGILTALVGAPYFMILLGRRQRRGVD